MITFDDHSWKFPEDLKIFSPEKHVCDCPLCNRFGGCGASRTSRSTTEEEDPCIACFCEHGHRNPVGECPENKGCVAWHIPPIPAGAPTLIELHWETWDRKRRLETFCKEENADLEYLRGKCTPLVEMMELSDEDDEYVAFFDRNDIVKLFNYDEMGRAPDGRLHHMHSTLWTVELTSLKTFVAMAVRYQFPTLEMLCVEALRRIAMDKKWIGIHQEALSMLPDTVLSKWFRSCARSATWDASKWMVMSGCCSTCYYDRNYGRLCKTWSKRANWGHKNVMSKNFLYHIKVSPILGKNWWSLSSLFKEEVKKFDSNSNFNE